MTRTPKYVEWLIENAEKINNKNELVTECVKRFKERRKKVIDITTRMERTGRIPSLAVCKKVPKVKVLKSDIMKLSVDVEDIKKEYDDESKIMEGIGILGNRLIKDSDFRMQLGVPVDRWKMVSGMAKFTQYKKELKGRRFRGTYWGNPEVIKQLVKTIDMV